MTNTYIRAMRAAGNSAWEVLAAVITSGREFPDAVFAVSQALKMRADEKDDMVRDYDECC